MDLTARNEVLNFYVTQLCRDQKRAIHLAHVYGVPRLCLLDQDAWLGLLVKQSLERIIFPLM